MHIAFIGDIHLISPQDPHQDLVERRSFFMPGQASLRQMFRLLEQRQVDLVIFLGDLVDWASEENIRFALEFLKDLKIPWHAVPGNHDLSIPIPGPSQDSYNTKAGSQHKSLWQAQGLSLQNTYIDCVDFGLILLDNALGNVSDESLRWLEQQTRIHKHNIVCQHIPSDLPEIRQCIHAATPTRNLNSYTCSGTPQLYADYYQGRVQAVLSGHVHMNGMVTTDLCTHYLCNLGISLADPSRKEQSIAEATLLRFENGVFHRERIGL